MAKPTFVYAVYIRTTPEKLWEALTTPEFTRRYWAGIEARSDWTPGSAWALVKPDGQVVDSGEIVESNPPHRLVISWEHQLYEEFRNVGFTTATMELTPIDDYVKLVITHETPEGGEKLLGAFAGGWPAILSSLKSLLETGAPLFGTDKWPES